MQAFQVANVHLAIAVTLQAYLNTPRSILDKHQVLPVECRESLFVSPFHGGLNRRAQSAFDLVDQGQQPEIRSIGRHRDAHPSFATLAVRRRQRRVAAQPLRDGAGFKQWLVLGSCLQSTAGRERPSMGRSRSSRS